MMMIPQLYGVQQQGLASDPLVRLIRVLAWLDYIPKDDIKHRLGEEDANGEEE